MGDPPPEFGGERSIADGIAPLAQVLEHLKPLPHCPRLEDIRSANRIGSGELHRTLSAVVGNPYFHAGKGRGGVIRATVDMAAVVRSQAVDNGAIHPHLAGCSRARSSVGLLSSLAKFT